MDCFVASAFHLRTPVDRSLVELRRTNRSSQFSTSSLRTQGPIHRALSARALASDTFCKQSPPVVMGPCVRRDDGLPIQFSNNTCPLTHLRDLGVATSRSRGAFRPRFALMSCPLKLEGAGNAGRSARPQPRAQWQKAHALVTTVTPETSGIPRAMVLTVSFVISPVTGLSCHRHRRNDFRQLDASVGASGPHDFAVRVRCPRLWHHPRPPHPAPRP